MHTNSQSCKELYKMSRDTTEAINVLTTKHLSEKERYKVDLAALRKEEAEVYSAAKELFLARQRLAAAILAIKAEIEAVKEGDKGDKGPLEKRLTNMEEWAGKDNCIEFEKWIRPKIETEERAGLASSDLDDFFANQIQEEEKMAEASRYGRID